MQKHLERGAFLFFLGAVTLLFGYLLAPFFTPILWALVLSILFYPYSEWLTDKFNGRRMLAVSVTVITVLVFVLVALFGVGSLIVDQAVGLYFRLSTTGGTYYLSQLEQHPYVQQALSPFALEDGELRARIVEVGQSATGWFVTQALAVGANAASFLLGFVVMLYLVFAILVRGKELGDRLVNTLPLERAKTVFLFSRFARTVRALFRGTLIVALAQGAMGSILFWAAGVQDALLWGVMMALFALIPAVGPSVIWIPAGIILALGGNMIGALVVFIGGALLVGLIDNVLRPLLIGRDLEMSDALVMLSIIGGLVVFGASGLVIGPVIAALFISAWELFEREYRSEMVD